MKKILIIDDDTYICTLLENFLKEKGFHADTAMSGKAGIEKAGKFTYDLILLDYRLPDSEGISVFNEIKKITPGIPVIIITAYGEIRAAVKLMKAGVFNYVTKPLRPEELLNLVSDALKKKKTTKRNTNSFQEEFVVGKSTQIKEILKLTRIVAPTNMTVLIEGETGTGKEYISRAIHHNSKRKEKAFVAVDCGAIPHELANSELFGHVKGSFTGAIKDKTGSFEHANGGTLFLDEIGNLPYEIQVKILRVLQERTINRVGENKNIKIDVRIIAASNEPLINMVNENKFREDVYHRINEFKIVVPPLRERRDDIIVFADHFREKANQELGRSVSGFTGEVKNILTEYSWDGNLRELRNVVKRSVLLCENELIEKSHLPYELKEESIQNSTIPVSNPDDLKEASQHAEIKIITDALKKTGFNKSEAARLLNVDRKTLYNKINKLNIDLDNLS